MAEDLHNSIFSDTECISIDTMEKYANDSLPPIEQQAVENHILDCALCSDALEGLTLAGFSTDIEDRVASLNERIANSTTERKTGFWKKQYTSYAAAVIGIMIMSGLMLNYLKTSDLAQPEFISQDVILETPPPPAKQDIPLSDEENSTDAIIKEKLDGLISGEITGTAAGDVLDMDDDLVPAEKLESSRKQDILKKEQVLVSDEWNDNNQADITTVDGTEGQTEFQSGFTGLDEEEMSLEKNIDADYRRRNEGENEQRNKATTKDPTRTSNSKPSDGKDLIATGEVKFAESEKTARNAAEIGNNSDFYYDSDRIADESKLEEPTIDKEVSDPAPVAVSTPVSSNQIQSEESLATREIAEDRQDAAGLKNKEYKSKSDKTIAEGFMFGNGDEDKKEATKGAALSGKKNNLEQQQTASEYNNPNTNYDDMESAAAEPEAEVQEALEYDDPNTLYNAVKPSSDIPAGATTESPSSTSTIEATTMSARVTVADSVSGITDDKSLPEQGPRFQGGEENLRQYLADNIVYPDSAIQLGIDCKVFVTFTVNEDSTISDAIVLTPVGGGCDEEALRLINRMPNWEPAQQKGKRVKAQYNLELDFESIK